MKLIVDQEAKSLIEQMCDICLKSGGLKSMQAILTVLQSLEDYVASKVSEMKDPEDPEMEDPKSKD
jgi:hypothetical protein